MLLITIITEVTTDIHLQINKCENVPETYDKNRDSLVTNETKKKRRKQYDESDDNGLQKGERNVERSRLFSQQKERSEDRNDLEIRHSPDNSNISPNFPPQSRQGCLIREGSRNIQSKKISPRFIGDGPGDDFTHVL